MPELHPSDSQEHKGGSAEKKTERSRDKLSQDTPEATVSAHRAALRANPNRHITVSPDGKAQSFGITDNGKLIASKQNTDNVFFHEGTQNEGARIHGERREKKASQFS